MKKKILIKINCDEELDNDIDGIILGIFKYSFGFEKKYNKEEIIEIKEKYPNKEIFVSLNSLVFNEDIEDYKKTLEFLDNLNLSGIIVGDIASLTYNLKTPLILDQSHLNNSYLTINHYKEDIKGTLITNDITIDEINEIKDNTNVLLFKQVFGYPHLSTSKRRLVSNYLKYFDINKKANSYLISEKEDLYYPVIEDEIGTSIYGAKILNLIDYYKDLNVDYAIIDSFLLDKEKIKKVYSAFKNNDKLDDVFNTDEGFINKKTIYRVKNNE